MTILKFPDSHGDWKFDLVGLLAIIGESVVSEIVQPLTASRTIFLPRLLPAPHALIRPSRRRALPSVPIHGINVSSGQIITSVPYFGDMIHQFELMPPLEVQEYRITLRPNEDGPQFGPIATVRRLSPLEVITIASSVWTAGILAWAIALGDGPAVVAIVLVSVAGSLHSAASYWRASSNNLGGSGSTQLDEVVLRTSEGAFVVVHCSVALARLLYQGDSTCNYVLRGRLYAACVYVGTLLLMVGIVVMSNCGWTMQLVLGASYLVLNGVYMLCALTPPVSQFWHWDLPMLLIELLDARRSGSYTEALWEAMYRAGSTDWPVKANMCPSTPVWEAWLAEAKRNLQNPKWNPTEAKDRLMRVAMTDEPKDAQFEDGGLSPPPSQPVRRRPTLL